MTTVQLREYRSADVAMPADLARAVDAASGSAVDVSQTFEDGWWRLTANSQVGTVVVGDVSILIRPKVPAANLFHMLEAGGAAVPVGAELFEYERTGDLLPAFATFFASVLERAVAKGIPRKRFLERASETARRRRLRIRGKTMSRRASTRWSTRSRG